MRGFKRKKPHKKSKLQSLPLKKFRSLFFLSFCRCGNYPAYKPDNGAKQDVEYKPQRKESSLRNDRKNKVDDKRINRAENNAFYYSLIASYTD